jgi:hypothetical protein
VTFLFVVLCCARQSEIWTLALGHRSEEYGLRVSPDVKRGPCALGRTVPFIKKRRSTAFSLPPEQPIPMVHALYRNRISYTGPHQKDIQRRAHLYRFCMRDPTKKIYKPVCIQCMYKKQSMTYTTTILSAVYVTMVGPKCELSAEVFDVMSFDNIYRPPNVGCNAHSQFHKLPPP